jgi:hypothetical protein
MIVTMKHQKDTQQAKQTLLFCSCSRNDDDDDDDVSFDWDIARLIAAVDFLLGSSFLSLAAFASIFTTVCWKYLLLLFVKAGIAVVVVVVVFFFE